MSYCFNPLCPEPGVQRVRQLNTAQFCSNCGAPLQLINRYRATTRIGEGQFGQTFLAVDKTTGGRCMIRQMPAPTPETTLLQVDPLRQRSLALRQISRHPQLPALLAWFVQQDYYYWISHVVDGPTLDHTQVALDETDIFRLLSDILPLLQMLHGAGVYHGDIKPTNIILAVLPPAGQAATTCHLVGFDFGRPYPNVESAYHADLQQLGRLCAYLLTPHPRTAWADFDGQIPLSTAAELRSALRHLIEGGYQSAAEATIAIAAIRQQEGPTLVPKPAVADAEAATLAEGWVCRHTLQGHQAWVRSVAVCGDGRWAASGNGDKTIKVWNLETGALRYQLEGHTSWVRAVAASSDSALLASASNDKTVRLWDLSTGQCRHVLEGHRDWVRAVTFLTQRRLVSAGQDQAIRVWDLASRTTIKTLTGHRHWVLATALTASGELVSASRDRTLRIWDLESGTCRQVLAGHDAEVTCITQCPRTGHIISGSADRTIRYWDPDTGQCLHTTPCPSSINSLAIQPQWQLLAAACSNKTIRLWNLDREPLGELVGHRNWVWSVSFSPQAPLASGSWDGTVKIWCLISPQR